MRHLQRLLLCCLLTSLAQTPVVAQEADVTEIIVVTGRQPGPPLWRVIKGDHVLWILPLVSPVPKDMIWQDDNVAAIIAGADEAIGLPDVSLEVSKLLLLNPINYIRGARLLNDLRRNPDDASLADVLPEDVYRRFSALKATYFPRNKSIEGVRPLFAAGMLTREILGHERLTGADAVTRRMEKLVRKQRDIRETEVSVERTLEGGYRDLSERLRTMMGGLPLDDEIGCFESQLNLFENHLNDMKEVANAWATGNARDMVALMEWGGLDDPCSQLLLASSEGELVRDLVGESTQRWLDAAVAALERNPSTFTMLPMAYITGSLSLVDRLAELGYEVHTPR